MFENLPERSEITGGLWVLFRRSLPAGNDCVNALPFLVFIPSFLHFFVNMFDDSSNDSVLDSISSSSFSTLPSPTKPRAGRPPTSLRLDTPGISPKALVGKGKRPDDLGLTKSAYQNLYTVLKRVRRSSIHPSLTMDFADGTTFQVLIDGYNPVHPGVPKTLEMDASLDPIFNPPNGQLSVDLTIADCAAITLMDKAHDSRPELQGARDEHWDQHHRGVAFKFLEENGTGKSWHCVWATLAEFDAEQGACVFRSFDDVFIERLQRSPARSRSPKKHSPRKPTTSNPQHRNIF